MSDWLPLTEYSAKYRVSISTLRRRIKNDQIEYSLEEGKYLLRDLPLDRQSQPPTAAPPQTAKGLQAEPVKPVAEKIIDPPAQVDKPESVAPPSQLIHDLEKVEPSAHGLQKVHIHGADSPVLDTANRLLSELKKAYMLILQEKEEQILQLKDELADLKTLVRVLESENDRLNSNAAEAAPIDSWLKENSLPDFNLD